MPCISKNNKYGYCSVKPLNSLQREANERTEMKTSTKSLMLVILLLALLLPCSVLANNEQDTIRVGWYEFPGLQELSDEIHYGYTYDYLTKIAEYTGWTYTFVDAPLTECLSMLERGEIDLVGGLVYNEQRDKIFDYPREEMIHSYHALFTTLYGDIQTNDYESFNGMKVAILRDSANENYLAKFAKEQKFTYTTVEFDSPALVVDAVLNGEADAGLLVSFSQTDETRVLAQFGSEPFYLATTLGNKEIVDKLNNAQNQMGIDDPFFVSDLYKKWFPAQRTLKLTEAEQAIVEASKTTPISMEIIEVGMPLAHWNERTGAFEGIAIELLDRISDTTGLVFDYRKADMSRIDNRGENNDAIPGLLFPIPSADNIDNRPPWRFTDGVFNDSLTLVVLQGHDLESDLTKKPIAALKGSSAARNFANSVLPNYEVVEYTSLEECLDAVIEGKADGAVYLQSCVNYLRQRPAYEKLEILFSYSQGVALKAAGTSETAELLTRIINKGVSSIPEDKLRIFTLNYSAMHPYHLTLKDILFEFRLPLLVIAFLLIVILVIFLLFSSFYRRNNKELEEALLAATQANAAKGEFMSRMSHEIRTPLNAIIGYNTISRNELAVAQTEAEHRQAEMNALANLTKSDMASHNLLSIINDVLNMSAIESGKIKIDKVRFDFKGLINSLSAVFYSIAREKNIDLDVVFDNLTDEWFIGDQMRTNQILSNILSNAIKFTPEGGSVKLTIRENKTQEKDAEIRFEISDTGIGMPAEFMERIWTPFEQADETISRRFGGTGLGLSITKNLVDLMGGKISVESEVGKGSTFFIELPYERTDQPETDKLRDFSKLNALVVDDDRGTCDYINLLFNRFGARSASVTSGEDAIEAFSRAKKDGDDYTVCLVDWNMPHMDGIETVRRIREIAGEDIPIIVISAYDYTEIAEQAIDAGVNMFVSKPLFQSSLYDLLSNICGIQYRETPIKTKAINFAGSRVLLVEDNKMNMEIAKKLLTSSGLEVDTAWNGQEAVDMFETAPAGTFKAILMDIRMPVMDGYTATRLIRYSKREDGATIPIIAMTADAFAENVAESLSSGMNDHISKPIDISSLLGTLSKYC